MEQVSERNAQLDKLEARLRECGGLGEKKREMLAQVTTKDPESAAIQEVAGARKSIGS
jgi:hypothetical protein